MCLRDLAAPIRWTAADGTDTVTYAASPAGVNVSLAGVAGTAATAMATLLKNIDSLIGSSFSDTVQGNGGDNSLSGGAGDDSVHGGSGDDTIDGGLGFDTLGGGAGNDTFLDR
jgi:Ca2+-binding RTX toxin-like protein